MVRVEPSIYTASRSISVPYRPKSRRSRARSVPWKTPMGRLTRVFTLRTLSGTSVSRFSSISLGSRAIFIYNCIHHGFSVHRKQCRLRRSLQRSVTGGLDAFGFDFRRDRGPSRNTICGFHDGMRAVARRNRITNPRLPGHEVGCTLGREAPPVLDLEPDTDVSGFQSIPDRLPPASGSPRRIVIMFTASAAGV